MYIWATKARWKCILTTSR